MNEGMDEMIKRMNFLKQTIDRKKDLMIEWIKDRKIWLKV